METRPYDEDVEADEEDAFAARNRFYGHADDEADPNQAEDARQDAAAAFA